MSQPITFAVCGFGNRGMDAYSPYFQAHPDEMQLAAIADPAPERRRAAAEQYGIDSAHIFESAEDLLAQPRMADAVLIATQDRQHVAQALRALELGYDILLEKPISPDPHECTALLRKAQETGKRVIICHVLRYTPFYGTLKRMLIGGTIGKLQTLDAIEHVGYWHQAHSFVRGNWRRSDETSPMILAKCCHDMDILRWLVDSPCRCLSSFGRLSWFRPENAPQGASKRCLDGCAAKDSCPYDAEKIYFGSDRKHWSEHANKWLLNALCNGEPTEQRILHELETGPYGRCVYHCDNNVVDHQVIAMEFENDVTATFTMTAFTKSVRRTIRLMGTMGEIEADMEQQLITVKPFQEESYTVECKVPNEGRSGHGGGDEGLMRAVYTTLSGQATDFALTSIDASIDSHMMALAAEQSRLENGARIVLRDFYAAD